MPEKKLPKSDTSIGIDVGIKSFLVDSEGGKVDNPAYFRQSEKLLRRRQRRLYRRVKGVESQGQSQAISCQSA